MSRAQLHDLTPGLTEYTWNDQGNLEVTHEEADYDHTDVTLAMLANALGGREAFEALPVLNLLECKGNGGGTGYIDFIRAVDMLFPVMRGTDEAGRPFVAFKLDDGEEQYVECLFRRYLEGSLWTSSGASDICLTAVADNDYQALYNVEKLVRDRELCKVSDNWAFGDGDPDQPRFIGRLVRLVE